MTLTGAALDCLLAKCMAQAAMLACPVSYAKCLNTGMSEHRHVCTAQSVATYGIRNSRVSNITKLVFNSTYAMLQVFQKIQRRLDQGLRKNSPQQLEQRLANQYQEYLHTVNTTAGVFRDTIAAKDYDPLAPR